MKYATGICFEALQFVLLVVCAAARAADPPTVTAPWSLTATFAERLKDALTSLVA